MLRFFVGFFLGFEVSCFVGFLIFGCLVSKFQSFKNIEIPFGVEDIDPTSKSVENLLDGSSGVRCPPFRKLSKMISKFQDFSKSYLKNIPGDWLFFLGILVSPEIKTVVLEAGTRPEISKS